MLKPSKFQIICILSSIIGLSLVYFIALSKKPAEVSISEVNEGLVGRAVTVKGFISDVKFHKDGHIFLTVSDNGTKIQVPLFSSFLSSTKLDISKIKVGKKVLVSGVVDTYRGQIQIIPKKAEDFKILGA
jgi:DNA/RNA endonuclease YhcR with UshA esterase domain